MQSPVPYLHIFRSSQIGCVGKSGKEELEVYSSVLLDRSGFLESQMRHFVNHVDRPSRLCFFKTKSPRHVEVTSAGLVAFWLRGLQTGKFWVFKLRPRSRVAAQPVSSGHGVEVKVMLGAAGPETEAVE